MTPTSATMPHAEPPTASSSRAAIAPSFAANPMVGMIPTIEATAIIEKVARIGACLPTPLSPPMSRVES